MPLVTVKSPIADGAAVSTVFSEVVTSVVTPASALVIAVAIVACVTGISVCAASICCLIAFNTGHNWGSIVAGILGTEGKLLMALTLLHS